MIMKGIRVKLMLMAGGMGHDRGSQGQNAIPITALSSDEDWC